MATGVKGLQWELEEVVHVDHRACLPDSVHGLHNVSLRCIWRFDAALRGAVQNGARPVQILRDGDRTDVRRPWHDRYWPRPAAAAADPWQTRLMYSYAGTRVGRDGHVRQKPAAGLPRRHCWWRRPEVRKLFSLEACDSPSRRRVKNAVDLHDIVVKQALDLDHRARWIGRLAPQLRLCLVHHGREAAQVADVDGEPHTILQARALRLRNQPDIEESLANSGVGILHQCVGRRIDPLHAGDKDEVTGPGAETPGTLRLDSPGRVECFHAARRGCLREAET